MDQKTNQLKTKFTISKSATLSCREKLNDHKYFIDFTEQDFFYNIPLRFCLFLQQDLC